MCYQDLDCFERVHCNDYLMKLAFLNMVAVVFHEPCKLFRSPNNQYYVVNLLSVTIPVIIQTRFQVSCGSTAKSWHRMELFSVVETLEVCLLQKKINDARKWFFPLSPSSTIINRHIFLETVHFATAQIYGYWLGYILYDHVVLACR